MSGYETVSDFLRERASFLSVSHVQNALGSWDVILTLDGSYDTEGDGKVLAKHFSGSRQAGT